MTNHWIDYKNSDVIMCIGANPAENHPLGMKWIERAREQKGAKLIVVDPRVSRTAQMADIYAPLRPGTDIAFLGGIINYALQNNRFHREYITQYTNAAYLIHPDYKFTDGLFSGSDTKDGTTYTYNTATWNYQKDEKGAFKTDPKLEDPRTVFQLMKQHYSRYDVKSVCDLTGTPEDVYKQICEVFTSTGAPGKAGNILYAMGITQSSHGTQNVRIIAALQLLLGNIGIAGGGVNAQRGESNVQGSTDFALLYNNLPGYNPYPIASRDPSLTKYIELEVPKTSYWSNRDKFMVANLKAWWGAAATKANDFCYDYLPKTDGKNHSHVAMFDDMLDDKLKGFFFWGQNAAVGSPNAGGAREAMKHLDWMVVMDLFETETSAFWKGPGVDPKAVKTEVFLLPAAASFEKHGTITNSGRWVQYREKAIDPPGDAKSDLWIADRLYKAIKQEYKGGGTFPDPILKLNWNYGDGDEPDVAQVALEINGYTTADGKPILNFTKLTADGATACGNWIMSGYWNDMAKPPAKSRVKEKEGIGMHQSWAWAWPVNRRVIYNRASADKDGKPWNNDLYVCKFEGDKWVNRDVPDFGWTDAATGKAIPPATSAVNAFIMNAEGMGHLFATSGVNDGPFPEHYEPMESPVSNSFSKIQSNPVATLWRQIANKMVKAASPDFPIIGTTYRLTEHYQSGAITRKLPWQVELQPEMFVEMSASLAAQLGVKTGDQVKVSTPRGSVTAAARVTNRMKPLKVKGKEYEMVGMPWHYGFIGLATGDSANVLTHGVGDPNTSIPEYKAFQCKVTKAGGVS